MHHHHTKAEREILSKIGKNQASFTSPHRLPHHGNLARHVHATTASANLAMANAARQQVFSQVLSQLNSKMQATRRDANSSTDCAASTSSATPMVYQPPPNLGPCGSAASGRYGEALSERLFFLKTTKTGGSTIRQLFERFAVWEHMGRLSSTEPGGVLFNVSRRSAQWLPPGRWRPPNHHLSGGGMAGWHGAVRPRTRAGESPYDIADDHSTWDPGIIDAQLPGARLITVSRDPLQRVISALSFFWGITDARAYLANMRRFTRADDFRVWNSVAWQLGVEAAREPLPNANDTENFVRRLVAADLSDVTRTLRERFALVMVTEAMTASVVLLRSLLCWRWRDVLLQGPPLTPTQQDHRVSRRAEPKPLDAAAAQRLRELNTLDERVHHEAKVLFARTVQRYGGAAALARDSLLHWRFSHAFKTVCLACCDGRVARETPRSTLPLPLQTLKCKQFLPTCVALTDGGRAGALSCAQPQASPPLDSSAHREQFAEADAAEEALLKIITGCGSQQFANVTVCHSAVPSAPAAAAPTSSTPDLTCQKSTRGVVTCMRPLPSASRTTTGGTPKAAPKASTAPICATAELCVGDESSRWKCTAGGVPPKLWLS